MISFIGSHVDKSDNPANLSEARPVGNFWSILKGMMQKNGWEAKTPPTEA